MTETEYYEKKAEMTMNMGLGILNVIREGRKNAVESENDEMAEAFDAAYNEGWKLLTSWIDADSALLKQYEMSQVRIR